MTRRLCSPVPQMKRQKRCILDLHLGTYRLRRTETLSTGNNKLAALLTQNETKIIKHTTDNVKNPTLVHQRLISLKIKKNVDINHSVTKDNVRQRRLYLYITMTVSHLREQINFCCRLAAQTTTVLDKAFEKIAELSPGSLWSPLWNNRFHR